MPQMGTGGGGQTPSASRARHHSPPASSQQSQPQCDGPLEQPPLRDGHGQSWQDQLPSNPEEAGTHGDCQAVGGITQLQA